MKKRLLLSLMVVNQLLSMDAPQPAVSTKLQKAMEEALEDFEAYEAKQKEAATKELMQILTKNYTQETESVVNRVKELIQAGADVNKKGQDGWTVLMEAVALSSKFSKIIPLLLQAGADVNARNNNGVSPLLLAMTENPEIVRTLIAAGADVNVGRIFDRTTALMIAARENKPEILNILLNAGADVERQDNKGITALMQAAFLIYPEIVRILLEAGANPFAKDKTGETALHYIMQRIGLVDNAAKQKIINLLLEWSQKNKLEIKI